MRYRDYPLGLYDLEAAHEIDAARWVDPSGQRREKTSHPYSYSEFYIWGSAKSAANCEAVYSDRLSQWDNDKFQKCCRAAAPNKRWSQMSAAEVSRWMSMYYDKPIKATALAEGCNISNGYPYWIIWFRHSKRAAAQGVAAAEGGQDPQGLDAQSSGKGRP